MDDISLPKSLQDRIERLSRLRKVTARSLVREAIAERVAYLEWEERALAEGQADLDAGRVMTTDRVRKALAAQRARRGGRSAKKV
jgi:predicted transcriptional regulator